MGFLSATATLLAALASGDAHIITTRQLTAAESELRAMRDSNAEQEARIVAESVRVLVAQKTLATERARFAQDTGAFMAQLLKQQNHIWDVAQREADFMLTQPAIIAAPAQKTGISRHDAISAAVLVALLYGIKRCYNAYGVAKRETSSVTVGAVCKKTGSLIWHDIRWLMHVLTVGCVFKDK